MLSGSPYTGCWSFLQLGFGPALPAHERHAGRPPTEAAFTRETSNCSGLGYKKRGPAICGGWPLAGTMGVSRTLVPCRSSLIEQGNWKWPGRGPLAILTLAGGPKLGALSVRGSKQASTELCQH
jgi:hypothetical protein